MVVLFTTGIFLAAVDIILYYSALFASIFLRSGVLASYPYLPEHIIHFSVLLIFLLVVFFSFRLYEVPGLASLRDFTKHSLSAFFLVLLVSVLYFYFLSSLVIAPKIILIYFFSIYGITWYVWRFAYRFFISRPNFCEKIGIAGNDAFLDTFADNLKKALIPASVVCRFSDPSLSVETHGPFFSTVDEFYHCLKQEGAGKVVLSADAFSIGSLMRALNPAANFSISCFDVTSAFERFFGNIPLDRIDDGWVLRNISSRNQRWYEIGKRLIDIAIGVLGIGLTGFLFPAVCLAIKIEDRGPVFYLQRRAGKGGKAFTLYKFRTMDWRPRSNAPLWTEKGDLRTTQIGRLLRRFHFDEIPQAINILKGDMSFVGPRAERAELAELFLKEIPFYSLRHLVRPGVTGWAQLHFPASASVKEAKEKLQYDLFYVKNRSFFLDLEIIFKTITVVLFKHRG